jgi:hypothetical protein
VNDEMDENIKTRYRKKHLIDRIHEILLDDDEPVITRNKFSKIRKKFDKPKTLVDEGIDGWGDDMEVDI